MAIGLLVLGAIVAAFMIVSRRPTTSLTAIPEKSIAVLPFVDMSSGKDQEYFSDGISEELLNLLAKIPQLQVTARTSSFSFKGKEVAIPEIARTLHVRLPRAETVIGNIRCRRAVLIKFFLDSFKNRCNQNRGCPGGRATGPCGFAGRGE